MFDLINFLVVNSASYYYFRSGDGKGSSYNLSWYYPMNCASHNLNGNGSFINISGNGNGEFYIDENFIETRFQNW